MHIFLSSARTVLSNQDFGVEQFFRADEFRADDPSPLAIMIALNHLKSLKITLTTIDLLKIQF